MAGATVTKLIGSDGVPTSGDLADLAAQLGLPTNQCHFEVNLPNPGYTFGDARMLSARARDTGDAPSAVIQTLETEI